MSIYLIDSGLKTDTGIPVKIGYSADPIQRLASIRTVVFGPTALLVRVWDGDEYIEQSLHQLLKTKFPRKNTTEVYFVPDVQTVLGSIEELLGQIGPPVEVCMDCMPPKGFVDNQAFRRHLRSPYPHRGIFLSERRPQ